MLEKLHSLRGITRAGWVVSLVGIAVGFLVTLITGKLGFITAGLLANFVTAWFALLIEALYMIVYIRHNDRQE